MQYRPDRPGFVNGFIKPKNTEIKHINGKWYLYERATVYDPQTGKSTKKSGKMLGSITADGFVPKKITVSAMREIEVVELGASQYFFQKGALVRQRLKEFFPDVWREIFAVAVIRLVQDRALRRCQSHYETSILSAIWPDLSLSAASLTRLLERIGQDRGTIRKFLLSLPREADRFLLVDGHRLLSASHSLEHAEVGYDAKCRYKPQVNLLYLFSLGEGTGYPEYYKQYEGSITDVAAIGDLLRESGGKEGSCTLVTDKGFGSDANIDLIVDSSMNYLTPLKRGNLDVRGKVPLSHVGYSVGFTYHGRSIFAKRIDCGGYAVHLFLDPLLLANESADLLGRHERANTAIGAKREQELARRQKGKGRLTEEELETLVPHEFSDEIGTRLEMGTISIRTNRNELDSQHVYAIYKQRQAIEQFFKTFDCTLEFNASYMRSTCSLEAWLFLNHLSMTMAVQVLESIASIGRTKNLSLDDFIQGLRKIQAAKVDGTWYPAKVTKKVDTMCKQLGVRLESIDDIIQSERSSAP